MPTRGASSRRARAVWRAVVSAISSSAASMEGRLNCVHCARARLAAARRKAK